MQYSKKTLLSTLVATAFALTLSACSSIPPQIQNQSKAKLETEVNSLGFAFSQRLPPPTRTDTGRGQPIENLVVKYAADYENDPYLKDEVVKFRRWQWKDLYVSLPKKQQAKPDYLNTYRLQAEVYLINKNYKEALSQLDIILRKNPTDLHALGVSIVAAKALEDEMQVKQRLAALKKLSPQATAEIQNFLTLTEETLNQYYSGQPHTAMIPDSILVFGQSPNNDGTPSKGLLERLEKTKEMANKYPNAKIILSGGPVKTPYAESDVMYKWLVENGVGKERLLLDPVARDTPGNAIGAIPLLKKYNLHKVLGIGTILHIPRATAVLKGYAQYVGYPIEIDGVGGGTEAKPEKVQIERLYTYVNVARSMGLFTLGDFNRFKR